MSRNLNNVWLVVVGAIAGIVLLSQIGATFSASDRRCVTHNVTDGMDDYIQIGINDTRPVDISFDRDSVGTDTGTTLTLKYCGSATDTDSCNTYLFDTTGNGLGDTNVLTNSGTAIELGGVRGITGFNYLRVEQTGTWGGTPTITVCRRRF